MPGTLSIALLLAVVTLQLQSAGATPFFVEQPAVLQAVTATSLIQEVEQFVKVRQYMGIREGEAVCIAVVYTLVSTRLGLVL